MTNLIFIFLFTNQSIYQLRVILEPQVYRIGRRSVRLNWPRRGLRGTYSDLQYLLDKGNH